MRNQPRPMDKNVLENRFIRSLFFARVQKVRPGSDVSRVRSMGHEFQVKLRKVLTFLTPGANAIKKIYS
jgi:hypothetical protein